jgi:hypothetical protein
MIISLVVAASENNVIGKKQSITLAFAKGYEVF